MNTREITIIPDTGETANAVMAKAANSMANPMFKYNNMSQTICDTRPTGFHWQECL